MFAVSPYRIDTSDFATEKGLQLNSMIKGTGLLKALRSLRRESHVGWHSSAAEDCMGKGVNPDSVLACMRVVMAWFIERANDVDITRRVPFYLGSIKVSVGK